MVNSVDSIMQSVYSSTQSMGASNSQSEDNFQQMITDKKEELSGSSNDSSQLGASSQSQSSTQTSSSTTNSEKVESGNEDAVETGPETVTVTKVDDQQLELAAALLFQNTALNIRPVEVVNQEVLMVEGAIEEPEAAEAQLELDLDLLNLGDQGETALLTQEEVEVPLELSPELTEALDLPEETVQVEVKPLETEETGETTQTTEQPVDVAVDVETEGQDQNLDQGQSLKASQEPVAQDTAETEVDLEVDYDGDVDAQNQLFQKVESAPVKVAETVNTQEPEMEAQIANKLLQAANNGDKTVTIQLTPENLGTITAQITQTAEGVLQIVLQASTSEAANLLNNHAANLVQALQGSGQTVTVEVQQAQSAEEAQEQGEGNADPDGKQQNPHPERQQQEEGFSEDFLQQMRLGLTSFEEEL